jgi:murein DD-endopeptidase MepM/ murein hydrolase activator NlpD
MRVILAILLAGFTGAIGYYIGRQSAGVSPGTETTRSREFQPPDESTTPPAPRVATPPAVETGPGGGTPGVPAPTAAGAAAPPQETGKVNEGVAPDAVAAGPGPLAERDLGLPIANLTPKDIHDTFDQARGGGERRHEATDIMAPMQTPVLAVDNGVIQKLFNSKAGGLTVYQFDPTEKYVYYYAHLDGYAPGLREGLLVKKGDLIGYVGVTGNSDPNAPHLHFAIFELGPEKKWYSDLRPVDPYPLLMHSVQRQSMQSKRR